MTVYTTRPAPPTRDPGLATTNLAAYYAAPKPHQLTRPDETAKIYLDRYVPRVWMALADQPTLSMRHREKAPIELGEHRPPFGEHGRHRRPPRGKLRVLLLAAVIVAIVVLPGVLG
jgi:hypothetical protein